MQCSARLSRPRLFGRVSQSLTPHSSISFLNLKSSTMSDWDTPTIVIGNKGARARATRTESDLNCKFVWLNSEVVC